MKRALVAVALLGLLGAPLAAQRAKAQRSRAHQARPPHIEAQELLDAGQPAEALELLGAWLHQNPKDAKAHLLHSTALFMSGSTAAGIAALDRSLELDPALRQGWLNRAALRLAEGDYAGAQRAFEEAERLDPDAADNALNIGAALLLQGDLAAATARFSDYLARSAGSAEAYYLVASNYAMTGYVQPAVQALGYAIQVDEKTRRRARIDPNFSDVARDQRFEELLEADTYRPPPGSPMAHRDFDSGFTGRDSRILKAVIRALEVSGEPFDRQIEVAKGWALVWTNRFRVKVSPVELAVSRVELVASRETGLGRDEWERLSDGFFRAVAIELVKLSRGAASPPPAPGDG